MNAATRAASISAVAALVLAAAWFFWPAQLGGAATYVSTHGISMEPGFSTGDLAVLRPADSYDVGDVVAYDAESLNTVVMHRIVAVEGDRFVLQGDNNDWLDEDRPTSDEVLGKLFRQVPQGGKALDAVASPWSLTLIFAAVCGLFGNSRRGRATGRHAAGRSGPRRRAALRHRPAASRSLATSFSMPTRAQARQVAIASGAVAILAAGAGAVLLAMPATQTEATTQPVTQEGRLTYAGTAEPGTTYPTGTIATGDPIYTNLVDALTISYDQTISGEGLDAVSGTLRLDVSVTTSDGWSAALDSSPSAALQDGSATASTTLDPTRAAALVGRHNAEIGGSAGSATIVVAPVVDATGSLRGRPFAAADVAPFSFGMDAVSLRPPADEAAFVPTTTVDVVVDEVVVRSFTLLAVDLPIDVARILAVGVLLLALLVTAVAAGVSHSTTGDAADAFAVRNAARILPVSGLTPGRSVVDVSDADALRRVAERFDGLVLHHAGPEGQTFAVQDNETTYRFVFPDTAITRTPPPPPPVRFSLAAPATTPLPRIA